MKKYSKNVILDTIESMETLIQILKEQGSSIYRFCYPDCGLQYSIELVLRLWCELAGENMNKRPTIEQLKIMVSILKNMIKES